MFGVKHGGLSKLSEVGLLDLDAMKAEVGSNVQIFGTTALEYGPPHPVAAILSNRDPTEHCDKSAPAVASFRYLIEAAHGGDV